MSHDTHQVFATLLVLVGLALSLFSVYVFMTIGFAKRQTAIMNMQANEINSRLRPGRQPLPLANNNTGLRITFGCFIIGSAIASFILSFIAFMR